MELSSWENHLYISLYMVDSPAMVVQLRQETRLDGRPSSSLRSCSCRPRVHGESTTSVHGWWMVTGQRPAGPGEGHTLW